MRTVYIGTSSFAVAVLERLADSAHRPQLVVTRPDRPRGRGQRMSPPPVAEAARALGLELAQPDSINDDDVVEQIAGVDADVVCVCAYGGLIREPLLSARPMLNVHPSLLPRWRGAAPIERAIMAGDEETGVSIMRLTEGLDSGPVCSQRAEPIAARDTYGTLAERLAQLGGELLVEALDQRPSCQEQDDSLATYAEKISAEDRRLDPDRTAVELDRVVRSLHPHIGAWIEPDGGDRLGVLEAMARTEGQTPPGELLMGDGTPVLGCREGELALLRVKPAGRREMTGAEWARGHFS